MISGVLAVVVWFVTFCVAGMFGTWVGWGLGADHEKEEAIRLARHTHREGDPAPGVLLALPAAGRLPVEPAWRFAGESEQGWAAESAEYELLTQTAELPEAVPGVDSPSDFEQSMTERVNEMIAAWAEQGNFDRHTMHEVG